MHPLILALDVGTSSIKTALFEPQGRRLPETTAHQKYALRVDGDGTAELAVSDLEQAALRAIRATLAAKRKDRSLHLRPIVAVGASCFWHSLLGYDAKRGPSPIYTWGDARCQTDAARLLAAHDEKKYHARTGCLLRAPYWPAKLRWLRRTGQATGITRWLSPADWLYGRLAGGGTTSISMASATGLMDGRSHRWDPALLRLAGINRRTLTPISDEPLKAINSADASLPALHRFPELKDALWFPALGDGAASNLGSDAVTSRRAALNIGTSGAVRLVCFSRPVNLNPGLFCYQIDAARSLIGGATSNAGNLRMWALHTLRLPDDPHAIEQALGRRSSPGHGLTVLPFWNGERAPSWPTARSGTITGLTYATTALDLLQALREATYHRLAQIKDELAHYKQNGRLEIVVSGGICDSPEALQRVANVFGHSLRVCTEPEASLRGAAVYVAERLGFQVTPLRPGRLISPKRAISRLYAKARQTQMALEEKMAS
jgi:gluconokinase